MNTMIRRLVLRPRPAALRGAVLARSQGTAAAALMADDGIANEMQQPIPSHFSSTIYPTPPIADHSSAARLKRDDGDYYFEAHSEALFRALDSYIDVKQAQDVVEAPAVRPRVPVTARDMDLVEASVAARDHERYDKILILLRHGEAQHNVFEAEYARANGASREAANADEEYPVDPMLTGKGCGQMLDVSRRTATFCTKDTGLQPDLFVVSPLRRAIQSALIAFPTHTALTSLSGTPWVCHPQCMEMPNGFKSEYVSPSAELRDMFPGVDFSLLDGSDVNEANERAKVPLFESKIDLMGRTDEFLRWIKTRDERVIVVSSHATWLQSLCAFSLELPESKGHEMFKKGEMRSVGVKFD